jgi:hypothetical protein
VAVVHAACKGVECERYGDWTGDWRVTFLDSRNKQQSNETLCGLLEMQWRWAGGEFRPAKSAGL